MKKTNDCFDPNYRIEPVAEVVAHAKNLCVLAIFAFTLALLTGIVAAFISAAVFWSASFFVAMIGLAGVSANFWHDKVGSQLANVESMLSIYEKVRPYPELHKALCRIMSVRPSLTNAEYWQFWNRANFLDQEAADKAKADALDAAFVAALKGMGCEGNYSSQ